MGRPLSRVLRSSTLDGIERWGFLCPGCRHMHMLPIVKPPGTVNKGPWTFSGDLEAPTITPSVHVISDAWTDPDDASHTIPAQSWCHSIITNGVITFLEDSHGHKLRGPHPLPPVNHPENGPPLLKVDAAGMLQKPAPGAGLRKWRAAS